MASWAAAGVLDHADLRAVAVGDDDLVALLDEAQEGVGGVGDLLDLLLRGVAERVAAEGRRRCDRLAERAWTPVVSFLRENIASCASYHKR